MSTESEDVDLEAFTKIGTVDDVPKGTGIGVDIGGIEIAIFNAEGEFYAISNRCAHQRAPLCKAGERKINADHTWSGTRGGVNEEEKTVACPWHLWEWDLETGEHEASGQRIGKFETHVDGEDLYVRI